MTIDCIASRRSHRLLLSLIIITCLCTLPLRSNIGTTEVRNKLCRDPKRSDGATKTSQRSGEGAQDLQRRGRTEGVSDLQDTAGNLNQRIEEWIHDRESAQQHHNLLRPTDLHQKTSNLHQRRRETRTHRDEGRKQTDRRDIAGKPQEVKNQESEEETQEVETEAVRKKQGVSEEDPQQENKAKHLHRRTRPTRAFSKTTEWAHSRSCGRRAAAKEPQEGEDQENEGDLHRRTSKHLKSRRRRKVAGETQKAKDKGNEGGSRTVGTEAKEQKRVGSKADSQQKKTKSEISTEELKQLLRKSRTRETKETCTKTLM